MTEKQNNDFLDKKEEKLYWTTYYHGDFKSASVRGCDVKTIFQTGITNYYQPIDVYGSSIFFSNNKRLFMMNATLGTTSTALYTDTYRIFSIYVYHQAGNTRVYVLYVVVMFMTCNSGVTH